MPEEVQVTQPFELRVANRVLSRHFVTNTARTRREINANPQLSLACVEFDGLHEPWRLAAKSCL
jgi:hypothetical protein